MSVGQCIALRGKVCKGEGRNGGEVHKNIYFQEPSEDRMQCPSRPSIKQNIYTGSRGRPKIKLTMMIDSESSRLFFT